MKITSGKSCTSDGWVGREFDLIPDAGSKPPHRLEISVSEDYTDWISDRMEAPVLAALFPAMALNEPIRIEQPLSAKFHYNLRQVMKYFHLWYPGQLSMIDIECGGFDEAPLRGTSITACFSGGVDSFYTLLHHRPEIEPVKTYRMTHGLFVHGFDIPLIDTGFYNKVADQYERVLNNENAKLIRLRTNLRDIVDPYVKWMTTHGAALNMTAHFLSAGIRKYIIPSTNRFSLINPPIGSNPVTDPQPSTEAFEIIHHGCEASRIEKVMAISDWPPAQKNLRVCFQNTGTVNCGACKKCHKVMMPLWLSGKLDAFDCFPKGFEPAAVSPDCFSGFNLANYAPEKSYGEELAELAAKYDPSMIETLPMFNTGKPGLLSRLFGLRK